MLKYYVKNYQLEREKVTVYECPYDSYLGLGLRIESYAL